MPLTQEQFQKARQAGFSTEQIISFEKKRSQENGGGDISSVQQEPQRPDRLPVEKSVLDPDNGQDNSAQNWGIVGDIISHPIANRGVIADALSNSGKQIINSAADLGENTIKAGKGLADLAGRVITSPLHPIKSAQDLGNFAYNAPGQIIKSVGDKINEYNSMDKLANKVSTDPFGFGADVVNTALLAKGGKDIADKASKTVIKSVKNLPDNVNSIVAPIRDYTGNKVGAIREGAKKYWKDEVKAYGDSIDSLANNATDVPSSDLMQKLTKTMVDRKLYDPLQKQWVQPLNSVDSQLVKSYKTLAREIDNKGNINTSKVIKEYQNIRDSVPIDSTIGREARIVAKDVIEGIKNHIKVDDFKKANDRYRDFRNNFDAIDKKIDVWGNPLETGKGERFLTNGLSSSKESRLIGKAIEKKTGQSLKGAKTLSTIRNLPVAKWIIR